MSDHPAKDSGTLAALLAVGVVLVVLVIVLLGAFLLKGPPADHILLLSS
jgi:diacylglycerol kinase